MGMFTRRRAWLAIVVVAVISGGACKDTPTTPTATTTTVTFASQLAARGFTLRSFETKKAGEAKVVFTSMSPDTSAAITLTLGTFDGTNCTPTATVAAVGGGTDPVLTTTVSAGMSCIKVTDPGVLTKTNDFYIIITIPAGS